MMLPREDWEITGAWRVGAWGNKVCKWIGSGKILGRLEIGGGLASGGSDLNEENSLALEWPPGLLDNKEHPAQTISIKFVVNKAWPKTIQFHK